MKIRNGFISNSSSSSFIISHEDYLEMNDVQKTFVDRIFEATTGRQFVAWYYDEQPDRWIKEMEDNNWTRSYSYVAAKDDLPIHTLRCERHDEDTYSSVFKALDLKIAEGPEE